MLLQCDYLNFILQSDVNFSVNYLIINEQEQTKNLPYRITALIKKKTSSKKVFLLYHKGFWSPHFLQAEAAIHLPAVPVPAELRRRFQPARTPPASESASAAPSHRRSTPHSERTTQLQSDSSIIIIINCICLCTIKIKINE